MADRRSPPPGVESRVEAQHVWENEKDNRRRLLLCVADQRGIRRGSAAVPARVSVPDSGSHAELRAVHAAHGCGSVTDLDIWTLGDYAAGGSPLIGPAPPCRGLNPPALDNLTAEQMV